MKKTAVLLLIISILFTTVGCAGPKSAKWDGYDETSFIVFLEKGFNAMHVRSSMDSVSIAHNKGWSITPTDDSFITTDNVSKGARPYTYTVNIHSPKDYLAQSGGTIVKFYMELKGRLTVKGAQIEENGSVKNLSEIEAKEYLDEVKCYFENYDIRG